MGLAPAFNHNQYHPLLLGMILERTTRVPVTQDLQLYARPGQLPGPPPSPASLRSPRSPPP
jgi:hypothetical protein